jgi:hypothetical protein
MGTLKEWIYMHWPVYTQNQIDLMDAYAKAMEEGLHNYSVSAEGFRIELMEAKDQLAAKELELATLKNKIVERAQVPSTLKAKTSADVRRIVEQANEAEFEEQANGR